MGQLPSDATNSEHHSCLANGSRPNSSSTSEWYRGTLFSCMNRFFDFHWVNLQNIMYYKHICNKIMHIIHVPMYRYNYG